MAVVLKLPTTEHRYLLYIVVLCPTPAHPICAVGEFYPTRSAVWIRAELAMNRARRIAAGKSSMPYCGLTVLGLHGQI